MASALTELGLHEYRTIVCSHCGEEIDVPIYCGSRFCPVCQHSRLKRVRSRIAFILHRACTAPGFQLKMITLTIRNKSSVANGVQTLSKSFRRLRAKRAWKSRIPGGLYVVEVTGLPGHYHVHLHILVDCRFFPVRLLSKCWADVAPGKVVYITRLSVHAATGYVTKYLSKPSVPEGAVDDVERGLKSLRLFQPFGTWHGISHDWVRPVPKCRNCGQSGWELRDLFLAKLRSKRYERPAPIS